MAVVKLDMMDPLPTAHELPTGGQINIGCQVSELTADTADGAIFEALNASETPKIGDTLAAYPGVVLAQRTPTVLDVNSPDVINILLVYVTRDSKMARYLFGLGFGFGNPSAPGTDFQGGGGGSLQQVPRSVDLFGNEMLVYHTWPVDDKVEARRGQIEPQGGSPNIDQIHQTQRFSGPIAVAYPNFLQRVYLNHVNQFTWQGDPPNSWKCVKADYELSNTSTTPYTFRWDFGFEFNPDSWMLQVTFEDDTNNKIPAGLVPGVGFRQFQVYPARDFRRLINI